MVAKINTLNCGSDTTAVSSGNSACPDAFQTINGTAPTFASGAAFHGSLGMSCQAASGAQSFVDWTGFSSINLSFEFYYKYTTRSVATQLVQVRTAAGQSMGLTQGTGDVIQCVNAAGTGIPSSSSAAMTNGVWYRIEVQVFSSATVGTVAYQMFLGDSTTPFSSFSSPATINTRGGNQTTFRIGKFSTSTDTTAFLIDTIRVTDGTLTPLGPWLTSVTSSRATTYNVAEAVTSNRATTFNVAASVTGTRATTFNVLAATTSSRATTFDVRQVVTTTRTTTWDVDALTSVTSSRSTTWAVAASVTSARAASWVVLTEVTSSRSTTFTVLAAVASQRSTTWVVAGAVTTTRATAWIVLAAVQSTRATAWAVLASVTSTRDALWDVEGAIQSVTSVRSTSWTVLALVASQRSTSWDVAASVTDTQTTSWDVKASVTSQRSGLWNTLEEVTTSRLASWATKQAVESLRSTTWNVGSLVISPDVTDPRAVLAQNGACAKLAHNAAEAQLAHAGTLQPQEC